MAYLEGSSTQARATRALPPPAYDPTSEMAKVDTLVLQALLARIEDERIGVADALHELDKKSMDLRALRAFKKVFDDYALGKEADSKVGMEDLILKDGKPVAIEVPLNTTLIDAVRYRHLDALTEFSKDQLDKALASQTKYSPNFGQNILDAFSWGEYSANQRHLARVANAKHVSSARAKHDTLRQWKSSRTAMLGAEKPAVVEIDLLSAAAHFDISLAVSKIADVQKITEQINNLISEESTEAQKLSTVANDKYQQLTQLVRELSNMTRMRHEGRLSTVNRI
ncbi:hypothetical protein OVY01_21735 [Robbsia sp. Bb-Pol-6]|uniref:Uncharacterized protein n=1 Tax=Robbsia betulipollinis TaxID=2981849 RepID=A0ABT3ZTI1_9BURK|nr:hypothetical protein [Robbsia betulipollinis]MCY0389767.1 hypothetical protein [Robbsia betulipollinis]